MNSGKASKLLAYYADLERGVTVVDNPKYSRLVVPTGNQSAPIHRWFHLKEAFSPGLLEHVLHDTALAGRRNLRVLDPYAGVGTTLVSVAEAAAVRDLIRPTTYGIETNGFLHLVASTKLQAFQTPSATFRAFASKVYRQALRGTEAAPELPSLSTFHRRDYFEEADVRQLLRFRQAIDAAEIDGALPLDVALARTCVGAAIEDIGNLRRDGRALRYTEKRGRPTAAAAFTWRTAQVIDDMPSHGLPVRGKALRGDGRDMATLGGRIMPFDLILFSPPYPNNIDYTEVYKLENWLLGFIADQDEFGSQRLKTMYSHPSILRAMPLPSSALDSHENDLLFATVAPILNAVPQDRYFESRRRMICGYVLDMYCTLKSARQHLAAGGQLVYVVGNSVHGRDGGAFVIAADLIIGRVAALLGYSIDQIVVARHLHRRAIADTYLRESVVFMSI